MKQYEMYEMNFQLHKPAQSEVEVDLRAEFVNGEEKTVVKGFYKGNEQKGKLTCEPSTCSHGMVRTEKTHFIYEDGTAYYPFGTTVYALAHQKEELIQETCRSLKNSPFNKVRCCVFPKSYDYNHNEPIYFPFRKTGEGAWGTEYSRQGCAEKIYIHPDGSIDQVEITSCGLYEGPLPAEGEYPAYIACHITDPSTLPFIDYGSPVLKQQTRITCTPDGKKQYITNVGDGSIVGFKYFDFRNVNKISLQVNGNFKGSVEAMGDDSGRELFGKVCLQERGNVRKTDIPVQIPDGRNALYFRFSGEGVLDLTGLQFS